jgi:cystathionine beta-lyase/cystathionine gamma-synthase
VASEKAYKGFTTKAVHVGQDPDAATGAVIPPIHMTSTYIQEEFGVPGKYVYSRSGNPTRRNLEAGLAAMENAEHAIAFGSGTAAIDACLRFLGPDDHVLCSESVYGGTYRLFEQILRRASGLEFSYVDTADLDATEAAWTERTRMLFVETPTNPLMQLTDLAAAAELAQRHGALLVVDNTFMSPYLQTPLDLGAHLVLHSTTKFLNGHSDSIGGVVCTNREDLATSLDFVAKAAGATLSPFEAWLIQRGMKTLALRVERAQQTAQQLAVMLDEHDAVQHVYYPGLASHPDHALARRQMKGFGAMISFDLADYDAVKTLLDAVQVCVLAESLGGVETLISHPASMTHASIPEKIRLERGLGNGLVRISVGIEDAEDLIGDLKQALDRLV